MLLVGRMRACCGRVYIFVRFGRVGCAVVRLRIAEGRAIGVGRYGVADELAGGEAIAEVLIEVVFGHLVPFYRAKVLQCIV